MNSPQKIVVIGATSAIAHQCSRLWAQQGPCDFLLVGRSAERAEVLAADLRARGANVTARTVELRFDDVDAIAALVQSAYAELVSRGRLMFVASHPERFADALVVEIVGYSDEHGDSPFWDAVGRNFFDMNYTEAERLCGLKSRTFLAELMPHYPIYVPLLPDAAQESMGQVHPRAQVTFDILMRDGFETDRYIDIFDGGPTLHAPTSGIRSIAQSRVAAVRVDSETAPGHACRPYLLCNGLLQDYRALVAELDWAPGRPVSLTPAMAEALGLAAGDSVRLVAV